MKVWSLPIALVPTVVTIATSKARVVLPLATPSLPLTLTWLTARSGTLHGKGDPPGVTRTRGLDLG